MTNEIMNDLYDLIKVCGLPDNQSDGYAELSRKHGDEARVNFRKLLRNKNIEIDDNVIKIGRHITIKIENN